MWRRELKYFEAYHIFKREGPVHVTAWVEMYQGCKEAVSHSTCDSVSWNQGHPKQKPGHSTCDSVSWKISTVRGKSTCRCHSTCDSVSWNGVTQQLPQTSKSQYMWQRELKEIRYSRGLTKNVPSHSTCDNVSWNHVTAWTVHVTAWIERYWANRRMSNYCVTIHVTAWVEIRLPIDTVKRTGKQSFSVRFFFRVFL